MALVRAVGEREGREVFIVELAIDGAEVKVRMTGHELLDLVSDAAETLATRASEQEACSFCDEKGCMLADALRGALRELKSGHPGPNH
jgi:hypothetical protein